MSVTYRWRVTESNHGWKSTLIYTVLRIVLWLALWAILEFLTPIKGLMALVLSLLISSAVSIILLDRLRDSMSVSVGGFFRGINERIEHSATAEEAWDRESSAGSAPGEQGASEQSVDEHEHPRLLESDDELRPASAADDEAHGSDR